MKNKLIYFILFLAPLLEPFNDFGQAPNLGTTADFVLFSSNGAVSNTGISQITGNVGTNSGSSTNFGNVNGDMDDNNAASASCSADLLSLYNQLNAATPVYFPSSLLGNGQILTPGVYAISSAATLNLNLILNGQSNPNAVFIFKINGSFSTGAGAKIMLTNGAKACSIFWVIEGLVNMASGTMMKGTVLAHNAAIHLNTGDTLEGRALSINGAVTVNGVLAYTPIGCGSPNLTGPVLPALGATACFTLFSSNGPVSNAGLTHVTGDVGTNVGLTTGFLPIYVTGTIHPIPDGSTNSCAAALLNIYTYFNTLPYDIELLYPVQFGRNLVLTPHTYIMNAATTFTDSLFLNAEGNSNAVFVIKINGAFTTTTNAKVVLINGTQSKNVYWIINGAVNLNDNTDFHGTIVCNNGAVNLKTGTTIDGRVFTTNGALTSMAITAVMTAGCTSTGIEINNLNNSLVSIMPNPFQSSITVNWSKTTLQNNAEFRVYDSLGKEVMFKIVIDKSTYIETDQITPGLYFYTLISNNKLIQSGKIISQTHIVN